MCTHYNNRWESEINQISNEANMTVHIELGGTCITDIKSQVKIYKYVSKKV